MSDSLEKKLKKAKIDMILNQPFFAIITLGLPVNENCEIPCAMATDGLSIVYNPNLLEDSSKEDLIYYFAHEVSHIIYLHHLRRGNRNVMVVTCGNRTCKETSCKRQAQKCSNGKYEEQQYSLWNVATDLTINGLLKDAGFDISSGIYDKEYAHNSAEKNYELLLKKTPESKESPVFIPSPKNRGDVIEPKIMNESERVLIEAKTKEMLKKAVEAATNAGKLPDAIERYTKNIFEHRINWKEAIAQFVSKHSKNDYNWSKRSRRYQDFYLPSLKSPEVGKMVVAIDTSGSLTTKDLEEIDSEIYGIMATYEGIELTVIYCDSKVNRVDHFDSYDVVKLRKVGGGGTDYVPAFREVEKLEEEPVLFLYFTDGYCNTFPKKIPDYPVMWILTYRNGSFKPPFGESVFIHSSQEEQEWS